MISTVEKYYSPESKLEAKLSNDEFTKFLKHNPNFLKSHMSNHHEDESEDDEKRKKREGGDINQYLHQPEQPHHTSTET